jgi:hypothetical protein
VSASCRPLMRLCVNSCQVDDTHAHIHARARTTHTTHTSNQPQDAHPNVVDSAWVWVVGTVGWRVSTPMERMWVMLRLRR